MRPFRLFPLLVLAFTHSAKADFESLTQADSGGGSNTPLRSAARKYQAYFAPSQFSSITTTQAITGLEFRLTTGSGSGVSAGGTWPSQALSFTDYTIQMSVASAGLAADGRYLSSTTAFSYGQGANLTTVRSGALSIPAAAFSAQANTSLVNEYGFDIAFTTPYQFQPGDSIVLTLSLTGYTPAETQAFFAAGTSASGQADAIVSTSSATAANASGLSAPLFVNFISSPVPEPGLSGLLAVGAFATMLRRRR